MASRGMPQQRTGGVHASGLSEALWACVLDDYLSEEEEGEFSKIVGRQDSSPWCLFNRKTPLQKGFPGGDPRDARRRGGNDIDFEQEKRDGTPAVWDDVPVNADMPPLTWLDVPSNDQVDSAGIEENSEYGWESDWDSSIQQWPQKKVYKKEEESHVREKESQNGQTRKVRQLGYRPSSKSKSSARSRSTRQSSKASSRTLSTKSLSTRQSSKVSAKSTSRNGFHVNPEKMSNSFTRSRSKSRAALKSKSRSRYEEREPTTSGRENTQFLFESTENFERSGRFQRTDRSRPKY